MRVADENALSVVCAQRLKELQALRLAVPRVCEDEVGGMGVRELMVCAQCTPLSSLAAVAIEAIMLQYKDGRAAAADKARQLLLQEAQAVLGPRPSRVAWRAVKAIRWAAPVADVAGVFVELEKVRVAPVRDAPPPGVVQAAARHGRHVEARQREAHLVARDNEARDKVGLELVGAISAVLRVGLLFSPGQSRVGALC